MMSEHHPDDSEQFSKNRCHFARNGGMSVQKQRKIQQNAKNTPLLKKPFSLQNVRERPFSVTICIFKNGGITLLLSSLSVTNINLIFKAFPQRSFPVRVDALKCMFQYANNECDKWLS
jgi:hypothetical protein